MPRLSTAYKGVDSPFGGVTYSHPACLRYFTMDSGASTYSQHDANASRQGWGEGHGLGDPVPPLTYRSFIKAYFSLHTHIRHTL